MADFHRSRFVPLEFIRAAIEIGIATKPDLICLTGDFISIGILEAKSYRQALETLSKTAPTFACMGNHDGGAWAARFKEAKDSTAVRELVQSAGIDVLHNRSTKISIANSEIELIGLGDIWSKEFDAKQAFAAQRTNDLYRIVLSHNPDSKDLLIDYKWDLMLSGHTHGGQVVVPFIGLAPFAPVKDLNYIEGLLPWKDRFIHITRGIGSVPPVRFSCRPEVSVIDLI